MKFFKFYLFKPLPPHQYSTLSDKGRSSCGEGSVWGCWREPLRERMESGPSSRLTTDSWKLTLNKGGGGSGWLEGPRLSFIFPYRVIGKTLCLGFSSFTMMCWGEIFFVFILLGFPGASTICGLNHCPSVLEYFQLLSFPPFSLSSPGSLMVHMCNHLTLSDVSLTLYSVFLACFFCFSLVIFLLIC